MNVNNTLSVYLCFLMKKMLKYAPSLKKNRKESKQLREKDGECMSDIWRHRHLLEYFFVVGECSIRCVGRFTVEGSSLSWLISVFNDFVVAVTFLVHYHAAHSFVRLLVHLLRVSHQTHEPKRNFSPFFPYTVLCHIWITLFSITNYSHHPSGSMLYFAVCFLYFHKNSFNFMKKIQSSLCCIFTVVLCVFYRRMWWYHPYSSIQQCCSRHFYWKFFVVSLTKWKKPATHST